MKQILDLKKIDKKIAERIAIMAVGLGILSEGKAKIIYHNDMILVDFFDTYGRTIEIHANGNIRVYGKTTKPEIIYNQREIQRELEPYWINEPKPKPKPNPSEITYQIIVNAEAIGDNNFRVSIDKDNLICLYHEVTK